MSRKGWQKKYTVEMTRLHLKKVSEGPVCSANVLMKLSVISVPTLHTVTSVGNVLSATIVTKTFCF